MYRQKILNADINTVLFKMTIPTFVSMLSVLLFNLIDTYYISLMGTCQLEAISLSFPIIHSINSISVGISITISTMLARKIGKDSKQSNINIFAQHGIVLGFFIIILFTGGGSYWVKELFSNLGAQGALLEQVTAYMEIWFKAVPLFALALFLNSLMRAHGNTYLPALVILFSGIINAILDPIFIFGFKCVAPLGIKGAAYASAISWVGGVILALYFIKKNNWVQFTPVFKGLIENCNKILRCGYPIIISIIINPLSKIAVIKILMLNYPPIIAAYGAAQKIESILLLVAISLVSTLTPFIAQNYGAYQIERLLQAIKKSLFFIIAMQLIIYLIIVPLSYPLATIFSGDYIVIENIWLYLVIVPLSYGFLGIALLLLNTLTALNKSKIALYFNINRLFFVLLPLVFFGSKYFAVEGAFAAMALGNTTAGIVSWFYLRKLRNQTLIKIGE